MRILLAEDEQDLNRLIAKSLEQQGWSVDRCYDGGEALELLRSEEYDAAVLDILMPVMDGRDVVRELRASGCAIPVLFLTALDSVNDRVCGLDLGADDYLIKPFAFEELAARIRAIMRKYGTSRSSVFTLADLTVDPASHKVTRGEREIQLSSKEFALLEFMIRNKGTVLSREKIENHIWSFDYEIGSNVVDVYVSYLRKKIDDGFGKKLLHTVWGSGWTLRESE